MIRSSSLRWKHALLALSLLGLAACVFILSPTNTLAQESRAVQDVAVRVGAHPTYDRIVFEWPQPVSATSEQGNGFITVRFNQPGSVMLNVIAKSRLKNIARGEIISTDPLTIKLTAGRAGVSPKISIDGKKVIIDVAVRDNPEKPQPADNAKKDIKANEKKDEVKPAPAVQPASKTEEKAAAPAPAASAPPVPTPAVPPLAPENTAEKKADINLNKWSEAEDLLDKNNNQKRQEAVNNQAAANPVVGTAPAAAPAPLVPSSDPANVTPATNLVDSETAVDVPPDDFKSQINIVLDKAAPVAAFERAGRLWVVASGEHKNMPVSADKNLSPDMQRMPHDNATIYTFVVPPEKTSTLRVRDNNVAIAFITQGEPIGFQPQAIMPAVYMDKTNQQAKVTLAAKNGGDPVMVKDTNVGDELIVFPVLSSLRVAPRYDYIQFMLPETLQGVVVAPRMPDIVATRMGNDIQITARDGRLIVQKPAAIMKSDYQSMPQGTSKLFPTKEWRRGPASDIRHNQIELEKAIMNAAGDTEKAILMLDIAHMHFAHGQMQEANAWLKLLTRQFPAFEQQADIRAVRGAARAFVGDMVGARDDFTHPSLIDHPEMALWQGYVAAQAGLQTDAQMHYARSGNTVFDLQRPLFGRLALSMAETALALNDTASADTLLKALTDRRKQLSRAERIKTDYLHGLLALQNNEKEKAKDIFTKVRKKDDVQYTARARYQLLQLRMAEKSIKPDLAIKRLESLRFDWRGDDFEVQILNQLGALYNAAGKPRQALEAYQILTRNFAKDPSAEAAKQNIQTVLAQSFSDEGLAKLSPVESLALFQDFKDMMPPETINPVKQKLAEQMMAVNFFEQADILLGELVAADPKSPAAITRLTQQATLRLLDGKPELAAQILSELKTLPLDDGQARTMALLMAKSLAMQGQYDPALQTITSYKDDDANKLRVDILWRAQRWNEASLLLGQMVGLPPEDNVIDDTTANLVMNRAVALALANDAPTLEAWRSAYETAMAKTALATAFQLVARPSGALAGNSNPTLTAIKQRTGELDLFKDFLTGLKTVKAPVAAAPATPSPDVKKP